MDDLGLIYLALLQLEDALLHLVVLCELRLYFGLLLLFSQLVCLDLFATSPPLTLALHEHSRRPLQDYSGGEEKLGS